MLDKYLLYLKSNFPTKSIVHVVIGNEAADIDSIASSIVYAFFKENINQKKEEIFIPVINILEQDLRLRNEAIYLFSQTGVNQENLIFIDQINLKELAEKQKLKVILVDHNKISHKQEFLSNCIEEVIDHHDDEKTNNNVIKTIEKTGSTATLVGEKIIKEERFLLDKASATILSGAILLDTSNLSYKSGKTAEKDIKVLNYLISEYKIDRAELFKNLSTEKRNISNLSSQDILHKDYKEWIMGRKKTGFSSVGISLKDWLKKDPGLYEEINKYYIENSLDILFIMIAYTDTQFKRELIVFGNDVSLLDKIYFYLQKSGGRLFPIPPHLLGDASQFFNKMAEVPNQMHSQMKSSNNLALLDIGDEIGGIELSLPKSRIRAYYLGETLWSRKRLQPVLKTFFTSHNS
ncbi:MAG: DHH family phosphoesterase [Spirochaetaceae bacterium]|nr:DHH family phosphoesterase [Spirochaetaceae bacterium]